MSYTQTKHSFIDPINFTSRRCEIRLPADSTVLTNLRIYNIGLYGENVERHYLQSVGVAGLIKAITLYDGNVVLDTIRNFKQFRSFQEYNASNDRKRDMDNMLTGSGFGFVKGYEENLTGNTQLPDAPATQLFNHLQYSSETEANSFKGVINLKDMFDFLRSTAIIPTDIMRLRVVIEWETNYSKVLKTLPAVQISLMRPYLACEELVDAELAKKARENLFSKGFSYYSVEDDMIQIPTGNVLGGKQQYKHKINGFNNKYVEKMLVVKEPTFEVGNNPLNVYCSVPQDKEKVNFTLEGKQLFSGDGIASSAQRLMLLADNWGQCNATHHMASVGYSNGSTLSDEVAEYNNNFDYIGFTVNDRVLGNLQVQYERQTHANGHYYQALNLRVYGKVLKSLSFVGGSYLIKYE